MSKRKSNSNVHDGSNTCVWTFTMDDALIDAYLHQQIMGNRVGGTFTTHALANIVNEVRSKFLDKPIDKERAQNRMKKLKRAFIRCYDIFKNGMSGFAWNPTTEMWHAEWMNGQVRNYEKLVQLYGQDRATGIQVETASEMRQRRRNERNASGNTIDEIGLLVSQNTVNLENLGENPNTGVHDDEEQDEASPMATNQQSQTQGPSSSSLKRISTTIETVANAILQSTNILVQASITDPTKDYDVWGMLKDLGISHPILGKAYRFLIGDSKLLEGLIRCPTEERKSLLLSWLGEC
ncbi:Myb/SANT-like domain-containing protein [Dioscorea alata]|uniref:Myb/SANT-like domain-containing protein n=1 Tax=Dioscorea alata TaxID=55571 RepID=A0ACB7WJT7_DIOAL|nr:Myb/SANT-like domain-containing protein [Dioscorea alata]